MRAQHPDQSNGSMELGNTREFSLGKCPFLGIKTDPETAFDYASIWNACHRSKPPEIPLLDYQSTTCLTPSFINCPIYKNSADIKFPPKLIERVQLRSNKRKRILIFGISFVLLVLVIMLIKQVVVPGTVPEVLVSQPLKETTQVISQDIEETSTATKIESETSSAEVTSAETNALTQTSPLNEVTHKLDVPIGTDYQFIIHQVLEGESLEQFAVQYDTSREVITKINYFLPVPLWVNWLVIIPVNLTDPGDLPTFEAYLVTEETISIGKLSEKLAVNLEDLSYYNGIGVEHVMKSGEWLLIPREGYMLYNP